LDTIVGYPLLASLGAFISANLAAQALIFGLISAVSLPLGAFVALVWAPRPRVVAALMAFGGGALLAALTLDLVGEALHKNAFYALAGGCLVGCLLFVILDQIVNQQGGFLRHAAINHALPDEAQE